MRGEGSSTGAATASAAKRKTIYDMKSFIVSSWMLGVPVLDSLL